MQSETGIHRCPGAAAHANLARGKAIPARRNSEVEKASGIRRRTFPGSLPFRFSRIVASAAFAACLVRANPATAPDSQRKPAANSGSQIDELYDAGRQLFDQFAPPEVKAQYEFPTREQWNQAIEKLERVLNTGSLDDLARYAPQARATLATLRAAGIDDHLADWLEQRVDELEAAQHLRLQPGGGSAERTRPPSNSSVSKPAASPVPFYEFWLQRVRNRPVPARAAVLMPVLEKEFAEEGVSPGLAWIAEAESSLNPDARSPAGAKGLFQLMPDTAHKLGLATFLPDERTNPEKSAKAAARYLNQLYRKFGTWPLALAAYNAGAGRVSRAMEVRHANDYADIALALPAETRMYVPKVCALVAVRSGKSIIPAM